MLALQSLSRATYARIYLVEMSLDSLLQYGVLVELAWSVLRPLRKIPQRRVLAVSALGVLVAGALAWPLSVAPADLGLRWEMILIVRLVETFAILRIAFFVGLAAGSHTLGVGWRNRELQVATGLGFYSLVSLAGSLLMQHVSVDAPHYRWIAIAMSSSYGISLIYWMVSFAMKEPPRPIMPDRMEGVLAEMAESAHAQRAAMERQRQDGE
jgi:hypothetical protein